MSVIIMFRMKDEEDSSMLLLRAESAVSAEIGFSTCPFMPVLACRPNMNGEKITIAIYAADTLPRMYLLSIKTKYWVR